MVVFIERSSKTTLEEEDISKVVKESRQNLKGMLLSIGR